MKAWRSRPMIVVKVGRTIGCWWKSLVTAICRVAGPSGAVEASRGRGVRSRRIARVAARRAAVRGRAIVHSCSISARRACRIATPTAARRVALLRLAAELHQRVFIVGDAALRLADARLCLADDFLIRRCSPDGLCTFHQAPLALDAGHDVRDARLCVLSESGGDVSGARAMGPHSVKLTAILSNFKAFRAVDSSFQ